MSQLSTSIICNHCGDRYIVERKTNTAGDVVRRGRCPNTPGSMARIPDTSTDWEMETRASS